MKSTLVAGMLLLLATMAFSARNVEKLNRGVCAKPTGNGIFVNWRLPGYESPDLGFNLYRDGDKLNQSPITGATCFSDNYRVGGWSVIGGDGVDRFLAAVACIDGEKPHAIMQRGYFAYDPGRLGVEWQYARPQMVL